ncbi:H-NS histone family protein [Thalassovita gelatinovora]|uniref:H-NS histone family protein n=1 Tax=Thalassovita gelatinovora TaxID=53501 RepID=A0A0P1FDN9_THAGE|nr:H-NS histone family protein [Thalassovita gelatinovora]SEQ21332.1 DNA-binding protein H-NS [Thalassovita gelatinovora]
MSDLVNMSVEELSEYSIAELKALHKKVAKAIETYDDRKKKAALAELEDKAKEMGFTLTELTAVMGKKTIKPAGVAKYRNPENPEQTWTGKGRRPAWFLAAIEAGKSAEDLTI